MTRTAYYSVMMRKLHALLRELNMTSHKASLLEGYGVEHASELTEAQLRELVEQLVKFRDGANADVRAMRSQVLSQLQRIGVYADNRDWHRVNEYLLQPRIAGKLLYQMTYSELHDLSVKLRSIEAKVDKQKAETNRLTMNN